MNIKATDQIAFKLDDYDTHNAYDGETKVYTFVYTSDYVVKDAFGYRKVSAVAGDQIRDITESICQNCGIFYVSALKKINQGA